METIRMQKVVDPRLPGVRADNPYRHRVRAHALARLRRPAAESPSSGRSPAYPLTAILCALVLTDPTRTPGRPGNRESTAVSTGCSRSTNSVSASQQAGLGCRLAVKLLVPLDPALPPLLVQQPAGHQHVEALAVHVDRHDAPAEHWGSRARADTRRHQLAQMPRDLQ